MNAPKRKAAISVLEDAISDRREFVDGHPRSDRWAKEGQEEIRRYVSLRERYRAESRVALDATDRALLRLAATRALSWRRGLLASYDGLKDPYVRTIKSDIREAEAVFVACGGSAGPDPFSDPANYKTISEIAASNAATTVTSRREHGREILDITEGGRHLGRIEIEEDGELRVFLPDGSAVNRPFASASAAQDWLLAKFSNNLLFSWRRLQGEDIDALADGEDSTRRSGFRHPNG